MSLEPVYVRSRPARPDRTSGVGGVDNLNAMPKDSRPRGLDEGAPICEAGVVGPFRLRACAASGPEKRDLSGNNQRRLPSEMVHIEGVSLVQVGHGEGDDVDSQIHEASLLGQRTCVVKQSDTCHYGDGMGERLLLRPDEVAQML